MSERPPSKLSSTERSFESTPEGNRTTVYHSILVNYLDYAKTLGFTHAHIWVSPPKQGDDYIFYAHPESMVSKRMGLLRRREWRWRGRVFRDGI